MSVKKKTVSKKVGEKKVAAKKVAVKVVKTEQPTYHRKEVSIGQSKPARSLDDILGRTKNSVYNTHDRGLYEQEVRSMNTSDLHSHSVDIGIRPSQNRESLIGKLLKEFSTINSSYGQVLAEKTVNKNNEMSKEKRKAALEIMSGGK